MTGWWVALTILLALVLLLQLRLRVWGEHGPQGSAARLMIGPVAIQLYPPKEEKKPPPQESQEEKQTQPPKQKMGPDLAPLTTQEGIDLIRETLALLLQAAKALHRRLRMDELILQITVPGGDDPAQGAMDYGRANALLGSLWQPVNAALHVQEGRAGVRVDFESTAWAVYARGSLSLTLGQLLWLGLGYGIKSLKKFMQFRRLMKSRKAV